MIFSGIVILQATGAASQAAFDEYNRGRMPQNKLIFQRKFS